MQLQKLNELIMSSFMLFLLLFLSASLPFAFSLRIKGKYEVSNETLYKEGQRKYKYLDKFGIFKGDSVNLYGTVDVTGGLIFAFIKEEVWDEFHAGSSCDQLEKESSKCSDCFIQPLFSPNLSSDLTSVSSSSSPLSPSASHSISVNTEMSESTDTQFWFAVFIYCKEEGIDNTWMTPDGSLSLSYEIFIINANNDHNNDTNPFTRQFPGNEKGFLFTYLVFSVFYAILIPVHLLSHLKYTIKCRTPQIINLFSLALVFEGINIFCGLIHYGVYAHNGYGAPPLNYMKTFFNLVGDWFLIIVLVLIAGGWMVTMRIIKWRLASFIFISLYIFVTIIYYIATVIYMTVQPWDTLHPLQEWPGGFYLTARGLLLFYVWYQIYHIHRQEEKLQKLRLYRALFGIFTVWFWYLPITVFIVTLINSVVSWVVLINIMNVMNFIVNVVMMALFCPFWSHEYFQFQFNLETSSMTSALMNSSSYTKKYQMLSSNSYNKREDKDRMV